MDMARSHKYVSGVSTLSFTYVTIGIIDIYLIFLISGVVRTPCLHVERNIKLNLVIITSNSPSINGVLSMHMTKLISFWSSSFTDTIKTSHFW